MAIWFQGSNTVAASADRVAKDVSNYGAHLVAVLGFMPGITSAELLADNGDAVTIKTNEGTMRRSHIRKDVARNRVVIEADELYEAGTKVAASSHFRHEFIPSEAGCDHHLTISDVHAPGFLGWLYRRFAARNIGKAFLRAYASHYDKDNP